MVFVFSDPDLTAPHFTLDVTVDVEDSRYFTPQTPVVAIAKRVQQMNDQRAKSILYGTSNQRIGMTQCIDAVTTQTVRRRCCLNVHKNKRA